MEYLLRDDSHFSQEEWDAIDQKVVESAKSLLVGRRFLDIYGPLGAGVQILRTFNPSSASYDVEELTELHTDFTVSWQDLEMAKRMGIPASWAQAAAAAADCAAQEDKLIFLGDKERGYEGLASASDVRTIRMENWNEGENAFRAVAEGLRHILASQTYGRKVLVTSPDVYADLQRLQPGTGVLESERIRALLEGKVLQTPALPEKTAVLLAAGEQNMDLAIGQDMITGYLGNSGLDHELRVLETILLRIKNKKAIVIFKEKA